MKKDELRLAMLIHDQGWVYERGRSGKRTTEDLVAENKIPVQSAIRILAEWTLRGVYVPVTRGKFGIGTGWLKQALIDEARAELGTLPTKEKPVGHHEVAGSGGDDGRAASNVEPAQQGLHAQVPHHVGDEGADAGNAGRLDGVRGDGDGA